MKLLLKNTIWIVFVCLLVANVWVFVSGVSLSDEISRFDQQIDVLHKENIALEKKLYIIESLQYSASMAAQLHFTKKSAPIYLDNIVYAFKQ